MQHNSNTIQHNSGHLQRTGIDNFLLNCPTSTRSLVTISHRCLSDAFLDQLLSCFSSDITHCKKGLCASSSYPAFCLPASSVGSSLQNPSSVFSLCPPPKRSHLMTPCNAAPLGSHCSLLPMPRNMLHFFATLILRCYFVAQLPANPLFLSIPSQQAREDIEYH